MRKSDPEPAANISGEETVSRFLLSRKNYGKEKRSVHFRAFIPNKHGQTSVYRITGISDSEIWRIGEVFVLNPINQKNGSRTLHGRGDIKAKDVIDVNLTLKPNPNPHPRHAEILDWPSDPIAQQQAATDLVAVTTLHLLTDQSNAYT